MSHQPCRISTPGISRKRKEREAFYSFKPAIPVQSTGCTKPKSPPPPYSSNRLLAGYMAHEFLTRGTLFGKKFDRARLESISIVAEPRNVKAETEPDNEKECSSYAEVASVLKDNGVHVPGIVNPTQLARWIQNSRCDKESKMAIGKFTST